MEVLYVEIYEIEIRHDGLNKYRHIRGNNRQVVEQKAKAQLIVWGEMWKKKLEIEKVKETRLLRSRAHEAANTNQ